MTLHAGHILRFKGRTAAHRMEQAEAELHGRCRRVAPNELMLTRPVVLALRAEPAVSIRIVTTREEAAKGA